MRDFADMGLDLENCEQWFERAVIAFLGVMFIVTMIRVSLHSCILDHHVAQPLSVFLASLCHRLVKVLCSARPTIGQPATVLPRSFPQGQLFATHISAPQPNIPVGSGATFEWRRLCPHSHQRSVRKGRPRARC